MWSKWSVNSSIFEWMFCKLHIRKWGVKRGLENMWGLVWCYRWWCLHKECLCLTKHSVVGSDFPKKIKNKKLSTTCKRLLKFKWVWLNSEWQHVWKLEYLKICPLKKPNQLLSSSLLVLWCNVTFGLTYLWLIVLNSVFPVCPKSWVTEICTED